MATKRNYITQKIDLSLIEILNKIREQEAKRIGENCSYRIATKILAERIHKAGGLKE